MVGNPSPGAFDPLRARVEAAGASAGAWRLDGLGASVRPVDTGDWSVRFTDKAAEKLRTNSVYGSSLGTAGHTSAPWDDPLAADIANARNTIACIDMPELKPYYDPNAAPRVYYHDRYPSIPVRAIIDDAIELLNKKKNLHITKISFSQSHPEFFLAISSNHPYDPGSRKVLEVSIHHSAFDRVKQEIDDYAGLKAKLDTNTYIKLRIAFLLYEALKLRDRDALEISLNIFKVHGSVTRPNFTF